MLYRRSRFYAKADCISDNFKVLPRYKTAPYNFFVDML